MGETTKIAWADATYNLAIRCEKVSEGCKFCYAERWNNRMHPGTSFRDVQITTEQTRKKPYSWKTHKKIFACSLTDLFLPQLDEVRPAFWQMVKATPWHVYQVLTKRIELVADRLPSDWDEGYPNVWLGVSAENQARYDERVPQLLSIPAKTRFVSAEPLLGHIDFGLYKPLGVNLGVADLLHQVIVGGESGVKGNFRPMSLDWVDSIIDQCRPFGVPVFVKQYGTHLAAELGLKDWKGETPGEWLKEHQIQEFPLSYNPEDFIKLEPGNQAKLQNKLF